MSVCITRVKVGITLFQGDQPLAVGVMVIILLLFGMTTIYIVCIHYIDAVQGHKEQLSSDLHRDAVSTGC